VQLSGIIGKARSTISEILSLNKLLEGVKDQCRENFAVPRRVLVEIAKVPDSQEMEKLFEKHRDNKLTRDQTRRETREKPSPSGASRGCA
jgi:ParB family chromosome partitioning protein